MPIYKNPSMTASNKSNAAGDDHASEAAKVKRTREQAYFNSYDFDAIEALPYDEDEDEDDDRYKMQMKIKQLQKKADIDRGLHTIHNGLIAKFRGLRTQSPLQNQRRHIQRGSLSSATPSSGSSTRSSSLSGNYSLSRNNYAYLQRLGTFLAETKQNGGETTTGKAKLAEKTENAGGHFSLPRPNLQYQSMNNDSVSMPLDANTVTVSSALSSGTTTLMTKTQTIATFPLQSNEYDNSSRSQARLTTKGFPMRAKKDSSSSSTISTDSAIVSANEIDTQKLPTISTLSTKSKPKTKTNSSNSNSNSSRGLSAESEKIEGAVGRYYSTNKSGSSGYYSSNVCSTYSIEDHIYSEPVALDGILDKVHTKSKSVQLARQNRNRTAANQAAVDAVIANGSGSDNLKILKNSRSRNMHGVATGKASANEAEDEEEADEADHLAGMLTLKNKQQQHQQHMQGKSIINERTFNENLRILENSIENLDRHLRNFPSLPAQEHIAGYVQTTTNQHPIHFLPHNLPTIMEGYVPNSQPRSWTDDMADDSLMDIDLDSFLLSNEKHKQAIKVANGIDNPSFLADEQEENNYKCAKYINSCPEDAYRVDSDVVTSVSDNSEQFRQRYEDQVHFENTRELLEDVRDKIRSLSLSSATLMSPAKMTEMPQELEVMIKALKRELENYLARINQHSDREIRQLCTGIVKNQNVVRMTKAFERRRSEYDFRAIPISIRQQITSIRCASDPNFKMKRKSLAEVFPAAESYIRSINEKSKQQQQQNQQNQQNQNALESPEQISQLQRNLSFHQPMLNHMNSKANISNNLNVNTSDIHITPNGANVGGVGSSESTEPAGDKDSILEWHRKKPSNWEMYYGTNRLSQSLLAAQRTNRQPTNTQATMSYPSSRPESDFTLDLPRAEQLRVKMEKEKKFRNRCRYIVAFLSLMFFLLTVVVVSLVLTRGKRMFGSMI